MLWGYLGGESSVQPKVSEGTAPSAQVVFPLWTKWLVTNPMPTQRLDFVVGEIFSGGLAGGEDFTTSPVFFLLIIIITIIITICEIIYLYLHFFDIVQVKFLY